MKTKQYSYVSAISDEELQTVLRENNITGEFILDRIAYQKVGYGHWKLMADIRIVDHWLTYQAVTTDSQLIDDWKEDKSEFFHNPLLNAFEYVLAKNLDKIHESYLSLPTEDETDF